MFATDASARRRLALLAVALGSLAALALPVLPSLAGSDSSDPAPDMRFHPVGRDGSLPGQPPPLRPAGAPLSVAERGYAIHLARQAMPPNARDVLGRPGGEVLAADLPPSSDRGIDRRATVSIYDYDADRLHQALVDLTSGSVLSSERPRGLQLPPSIAETSIATQLAVTADPTPAFVTEYRRLTGAELIAAEQVHAVAGVWRPADEAAVPSGPTEVCGRHRCLQLLLALPSGQYLGTQDFAVDLSSRTVLPVQPTPSDEPERGHEH